MLVVAGGTVELEKAAARGRWIQEFESAECEMTMIWCTMVSRANGESSRGVIEFLLFGRLGCLGREAIDGWRLGGRKRADSQTAHSGF